MSYHISYYYIATAPMPKARLQDPLVKKNLFRTEKAEKGEKGEKGEKSVPTGHSSKGKSSSAVGNTGMEHTYH